MSIASTNIDSQISGERRREERVGALVLDDAGRENVVIGALVVAEETVDAHGDAVAEDSLIVL